MLQEIPPCCGSHVFVIHFVKLMIMDPLGFLVPKLLYLLSWIGAGVIVDLENLDCIGGR